MEKNRKRLAPFTCLSEILRMVAMEIVVKEEDADAARGLNKAPLSPEKIERNLQLLPTVRLLQDVEAAGRLFLLLNRPVSERPTWVDYAPGFPLIDDSAAKDGLAYLALVGRVHPNLNRGGLRDFVRPETAAENSRVAQRSTEIGFMNDEFWDYFDSSGVPQKSSDAGAADDLESCGSSDVDRERTLYVERMTKLIRELADHQAKELIIQALKNAEDPRSPTSVWVALKSVVRNKGSDQFVVVNEWEIRRPRSEGIGTITVKNLGKFLSDYRKKMPKNNS